MGGKVMVYKPTLEDMYFAMKEPLMAVGGYGKLDDEQRDLFNAAVDAIMMAKFAEGEPRQEQLIEKADKAVTQFLGAMPPVPEERPDELPEELPSRASVIDKLTSSYETVLIRAADALDRAGKRELADELDALLSGKEKK